MQNQNLVCDNVKVSPLSDNPKINLKNVLSVGMTIKR